MGDSQQQPTRQKKDTAAAMLPDSSANLILAPIPVPPLSSSSSSGSSSSNSSNTSTEDQERDGRAAAAVDPRAISLLETRVFCLLDEVLEADHTHAGEGLGLSVVSSIKKHIVSLLVKSIDSFFNGTVVRWVQAQAQPETAVAQTAALVCLARECSGLRAS